MIKLFLNRVVCQHEGSSLNDYGKIRPVAGGGIPESQKLELGEKEKVEVVKINEEGEAIDLSKIKTVKDLQKVSKRERESYFRWKDADPKLLADFAEKEVKTELSDRRKKFQNVGLTKERMLDISKSWCAKRGTNIFTPGGTILGAANPQEPVKILNGKFKYIDGGKYVYATITHGPKNKKITGYIRVRDIMRPIFEGEHPSPKSIDPKSPNYERPYTNPNEVDRAPGEKPDLKGPEMPKLPEHMPTSLRRQKFKEAIFTKGENLNIYGDSWQAKQRTTIFSTGGDILGSANTADKVKIEIQEAKYIDNLKYAYAKITKPNGKKITGYVKLLDLRMNK